MLVFTGRGSVLHFFGTATSRRARDGTRECSATAQRHLRPAKAVRCTREQESVVQYSKRTSSQHVRPSQLYRSFPSMLGLTCCWAYSRSAVIASAARGVQRREERRRANDSTRAQGVPKIDRRRLCTPRAASEARCEFNGGCQQVVTARREPAAGTVQAILA